MESEWILDRLARGAYRVDLVGSRQGPVAVSCEYGAKPSGSGATELVSYVFTTLNFHLSW
jgi:hypothetical protein